MSITFYGSWSLTVVSKEAAFEERATIAGSLASDGVVAGVPGVSVAEIEGEEWTVEMEWSSDGGVNWYPSRIRRAPAVVPGSGLVVTLRADDNTPQLGDGDFNDLVIALTYLNQEVNPPGPQKPPYEFTMGKEAFLPKRPRAGREACGCGCHSRSCGCHSRPCGCRPRT